MLIRILLAIYLVLGFAGQAVATSCTPFKHDYFVRCDTNGCAALFSVREVSAFRMCERRPHVESVDPRVDAFINKMIVEMHSANARGQYRLSLVNNMWWEPIVDKFQRFVQELEATLPRDGHGNACKVEEIPISEIASLLGKEDSRKVLSQISKDASIEGAAALRGAFESQALRVRVWTIARQIGYWASSLLFLFALIHSQHVFFSRLYLPRPQDGKLPMYSLVAIQLAVIGVGVGALLYMPGDFWPGTFLVPAAVLILLGEGWAKFLVARRKATQ